MRQRRQVVPKGKLLALPPDVTTCGFWPNDSTESQTFNTQVEWDNPASRSGAAFLVPIGV